MKPINESKRKDLKESSGNQKLLSISPSEMTPPKQKKINIIQFLNIADNSLHPQCAVNVDEPIFQPEPYEILFDHYEPLQILTRVLKLRNRDIVPRRVSIIHPENRLFQVMPFRNDKNISSSSDQGETVIESASTKVAPGMEVSYLIKFTPEAKVDISYDLIVITEREKFTVPIRGIGCKVNIEFTDKIDFGEVPVKYKIEKPFILRNVGEKITKWMLKCSSTSVTISKMEGILDIGKSEQIICTFCPEFERIYTESMTLSYDETEHPIKILGKSKNDRVSIFPTILEMDPAYITLHTEKTVAIINDTAVPIDYVWKMYESKFKEQEAKSKVFDNLKRQEAEEKILNELQHTYEENPFEDDTSIDLEDSYDEDEIIRMNERNHLKNQNLIARRFEKIVKSLNEDQMCFEHQNFSIETLSGKVWPNTQATITVSFSPSEKREYRDIFAFLDVTGSEKRLKLELRGKGIGPKAKILPLEGFNLGDIPITKIFTLEQKLTIQNIGVIPCDYAIESPGTPCSKQFTFEKTHDTIPPRGEKESGEHAIQIDFVAARLGEFSEKFHVNILKSKELIPVTFKGHVIAPYCKFSRERIDFEKVSMGFQKPETVILSNESDVPINFRLRIATDATDNSKQMETVFDIQPKEGKLEKKSNQEIKIIFRPDKERPYDIVVLLDMIDIGFDMLTLPVSGICEIPEVIISPKEILDFGDVYINKEETRQIRLTNTSSTLSSQFTIIKQDSQSITWAEITCFDDKGTIEPDQTVILTVQLKAVKLGLIRLKLEIDCKTKGWNPKEKENFITPIPVWATSKGPYVRVYQEKEKELTKEKLKETEKENLNVLDFGPVPNLESRMKILRLENTSPIEAYYTAFMKQPRSIFSIKNPKDVIKAHEIKAIEVYARPDEQMKFPETLYFKIVDSEGLEVALSCIGTGTTIVPECDLSVINFGTIFTSTNVEKVINFQNFGRSEQQISWVSKKPKKKIDDKNVKNNPKKNEEEVKEVFTFYLDQKKRTIPSTKQGTMSIYANSKKLGPYSEEFGVHCCRVGDTNSTEYWTAALMAEFVEPQLLCNPQRLDYVYKHDEDQNKLTITKKVRITNVGKLLADFTVIAESPFSINKDKFLIEPKQSDELQVDFNPESYKKKKQSKTFFSKLFFKHNNHEKEDNLNLSVKINFPNILDLPSDLNFECLLNDTFAKKKILLERDASSDLEIAYEWQLIEVENSYESIKKGKNPPTRKIPMNEVFSIVPMNGRLKKGELESDETVITFIPGANQRYTAIARCLVDGGPEYNVKLIGEASDIKYKIQVNEDIYDMNKKEFAIKFGEIPFNSPTKIDMLIKNEGEVPFNYRVTYVTDKLRYLALTNAVDRVQKADFKKVTIEIIPGIPEKIDDEIVVEIEHFEPIRVKIKAIGCYSGIIISGLSRNESNFRDKLSTVEQFFEERKKQLEEYYKEKKPKKTGLADPKANINATSLQEQYELDINRQFLCEKLIDKMTKTEIFGSPLSQGNSTSASPNSPPQIARPPNQTKPIVNSSAYRVSQLLNLMKDMTIAAYEYSFGNIVAGHSESVSFLIHNFNKGTLTISMDKKANKNYIIEAGSPNNDKCFIEENKSLPVTVTHSTSVTSQNELADYVLKISMESGEVYEVHLHSFIAVPNLTLHHANLIDMKKVYLGRKKIMNFRVENTSRVECSWVIQNKDTPSKKQERDEKKDDLGVFNISPVDGKLQPGKKLTITVVFEPRKTKPYQSKYSFNITYGKQIDLFLKGLGEKLELLIKQDNVTIGPILPYYKYGLSFVEFINPNDTDIEVYSTDFDENYLKEEDMIRYYRTFSKNPTGQIDLPIRSAGNEIWKRFQIFYSKFNERVKEFHQSVEEIVNKSNTDFTTLASGTIFDRISAAIEELDDEEEIKIPPPIDKHDKLNIILLGPERSGKTSILKGQRMKHKRGLVHMPTLVDWNFKNGFEQSAAKVKQYLDDKKKEFEIQKADREKLVKQAKTNKKIVVPEPPNEEKFKYVSKEIMMELLRNRLSCNDCSSVGCVFDDFYSNLVESQEVLLEIVEEVLQNENLMLAYIEFPKDQSGMEACPYIDWGKYSDDFQKNKKKRDQSHSGRRTANVMTRRVIDVKDRNKSKPGSSSDSKTPKITSTGSPGRNKEMGGKNEKDKEKEKEKEQKERDIKKSETYKMEIQNQLLTHYELYSSTFKSPTNIAVSAPKRWNKEEMEQYMAMVENLKTKMQSLKENRMKLYEDMKNDMSMIKNEPIETDLNQLPGSNNNPNFINSSQNNMNLNLSSAVNTLMHSNNSLPSILPSQLLPVERSCQAVCLQYCIPQMLQTYLKAIPEPKQRDPEEMDLPPDEELQIVKRPSPRAERQAISNFSLKGVSAELEDCTIEKIVELMKEEEKRFEEFNKNKEAQALLNAKEKKKIQMKTIGKDTKTAFMEKEPEFIAKEILTNKTRWMIKKGQSVKAVVGFFSKEIGMKAQPFEFEILSHPPIPYKITLNGISDYPSLNTFTSKNTRSGTIALRGMSNKKYEEDFGYILITKDDKRIIEKYKSTNCRVIKFTNNGKFDLRVDFVLLSSMSFEGLGFPLPFTFVGADPQGSIPVSQPVPGQKNIKVQSVLSEPITPYILPKTFLEIKKDQTAELEVYTFPNRPVEYKDEILCLIKDNPAPIKVSLSCKGAEPRVDLEQDVIDFEKLVVGQPRTRYIKLKNVSEVTCKWALTGLTNLPPQYKIERINGIIEKGKEVLIGVTFVSEKQDKFPFQMNLEIEDNLDYGVKLTPKIIKLLAEAFKVTVDLVINNEGKIIDFGKVKVKEYRSFPFMLRNLGLYKVRFKFEIMKKLWQELFKFEPSEGEIEPGKDRNIIAIFMRHAKDHKIYPKNTSEIKLTIYEGERGTKNHDINILVNVESYFSKYSINPLKTINFGSMPFNETATRSIEIRNEGQFEFNYEISEYLHDEAKMRKLKEEKDQKEIEEQKIKEQELKDTLEGIKQPNKKIQEKKLAAPQGKQGQGKKQAEDELKIQRYTIKNYKGVVAPESSAKIDIIFTAEGQQFCPAMLAIDIQGRQPDDYPLGIPFDLVAESCIPGIETQDFDNIFEEQTVLPSINPEINRQNIITSAIYGIEEKVFWFGTVIAGKNPNGITERFKLINNNKIPCIVKVNVKPRTNSKSEGFAFTVSHKTPLKIYPNESEYVKVTFTPTNVMPYSASFEAIVEGGINPETGALKFELRGEGTLPTIVLDPPQEFDIDGTPILRFKKTRLNRAVTSQIVLKNEGVVPATLKFEPLAHECFSFDSSTTATLQPKKYQKFDVRFTPINPSIEKAVIQYKTLFNSYENPKMYLIGEGFFEPISIDGLVNDTDLNFGDVCIGVSKTINFSLINHSETPYRFSWVNVYEPSLDLCPSVGILLPKTTKTIQATFCSKETVKHVGKDLYMELKMIKFNSGNFEDWDNSMKGSRKVTSSEYAAIMKKRAEEQQKRKEENEILAITLAGGKKGPQTSSNKKDAKKKDDEKAVSSSVKEEPSIDIEEVIPEPLNTVVDKNDKYPQIKLTAISDYVKYQCNVKEVKFKPTVMYGTRKFDYFQLKNTSVISMNYKFTFINPNPTNTTHLSNNMLTSSEKMVDNNAGGAFTVTPQSGTIPGGSDEPITVRFSPMEIDEFNFRRIMCCSMKDLDPSFKELQIELSGDAERPMCHFELENAKRENGCTVIEFESVGMMIKNTARFYALNPTNQGYEFEWEQQDEELIPNINKVFKCITPKGIIYSGKKFEMIFEYTPNTLGQHQAFWNFKIINENLPHKFMLSGTTREPLIVFNVGKLNFGALLIGGRVKETIQIINEEHLPYRFTFDKESIKGNNTYGDSLFVTPIAGTLQPKSSTPVEITFMPRVEREFNYNLILRVKQRYKPLTLNVKGDGYTILHGVYLDNKPDLKLLFKQEHVIDFGEFFINDKRERSIRLENNGRFNFHFNFKKNGADYLKISPDNGIVSQTSRTFITLTLLPLNKINLQNHKIYMNIVSGPTYTFLLNAKARTPQIIFSSVSCNFGPCYVMRQPMPTTQIITVKNMDKEALTIETNFDGKNKSYLDVQLSTGQVILPYASQTDVLEIPIVFIPRDFIKYRDIIKFKFNGIYDVDVEVTGEGIPLRVELEDPSQQSLNFGIIKLGQSKTLSFLVVNRGKMAVAAELYPENPSTFVKRCLSLKTDFDEEDKDETASPVTHVLQPKEAFKVEVLFNPSTRIPQFGEDIMIKVNNSEKRRLLTITGASYGVDVKIVGEMPTFGVVTVNSMALRQITLRNFGDIPAVFTWDTMSYDRNDYTKYFTISPLSGTIPPHEDCIVDLVFHPKEVNNSITFEKIKCTVEDFETPLLITLYGKSIECPTEFISEKRLETQVRVPVKYEIKIKNTSDKLWRISPSISSSIEQYMSYFKGSDQVLEIKPGAEAIYTLTYEPLTMSKSDKNSTEKSKEHDAIIFFPLPDGNAKIHRIFGTSLPPSAQKIIPVTAVAREWTPIKLEISNWLYKSQRFKVNWGKTDTGIFIKGANTIDIASNSTKEYKLSFRSLKEGPINFQITFENVETKEYVFFIINVTVTPPFSFPVTELVGVVREVAIGSFIIANPLSMDVQVNTNQIQLENEYLNIKPNSFKILAESEMPIDVSFRPLTVGKFITNVIIKSPELGDLKYPISIEGIAAQPKVLQPIQACLGSDKIVQLYFTHYLKKPAVYQIKVEKYVDSIPFSDFYPEAATINAVSAENMINLRYEPSNIYESKAILKVSSPEGGEYSWILSGHGLSPQAQGPYKIPTGKNYTLEFKNPLNEAVDLTVRFDTPNFFIAGGKINSRLDSKKLLNITIGYKAQPNDQTTTGRVIITVNKLPPFIYYLYAE